MHNQRHIISNDELIKNFVPRPLENYFYTKLKNESPDYVKLKLCELLKFLTLSHYSFGNIPFNAEIDEMWHLWILQTVQYQELMKNLPGKKFIHHSSNDYKDDKNALTETKEMKELEANKQFSYLISYIANFGNFTWETVKFWPMANNLMEALHFDVDMLNIYLQKLI